MNNPFLPTRYELDRDSPLWRSAVTQQLDQRRSIYVIGTRGTGKTSLFRSIYWADILRGRVPDPNQKSNREKRLLLGLYIRPPLLQMSVLDDAPLPEEHNSHPFNESIRFDLFSYLLTGAILCDLFSAISALRGAGRFSYSVGDEQQFVTLYTKTFPALLQFNKRSRNITDFISLSELFEDFFDNLRIRITRGQVSSILNNIPPVPGNELLHRTNILATQFLREKSDLPDVCVRVCVDDCESFTRLQQRYLNSLVRDQRSDIFWTLAYVDHNFDAVAVLQKGQSLSDADRVIVDLNNQPFDQFSAFCNEVTRLRLSNSGLDSARFTALTSSTGILKSILGDTDVNAMFERLISHSKNPLVHAFHERAALFTKRYHSHFRSGKYPTDAEIEAGDTESILYYQCYLYETLVAGGPFTNRKEIKLREGPWFRRKMRAALLHFSRRYELSRIPYYGWQSIVSLSDNCVRDYLETMAAIFEDIGTSRLRSAKRTIGADSQRKACERSSRQKFESIREVVDDENRHVTILVQFLGKLTAQLQSDPGTVDPLRTPERGVYHINYQHYLDNMRGTPDLAATRVGSVRRLISRAENGGFLRMVIPEEHVGLPMDRRPVGEDRFTLHRRFAPLFGFSYRGPYEPVALPVDAIASIYEDADSFSVDSWVNTVVSLVLSSTPDQISLNFDGA